MYNTYRNVASTDGTAGRAALQLSIWKVLYDTGDLDITSGHFYETGASPTAVTLAGTWLGSLPTSGFGNAGWYQLVGVDGIDQNLIGAPAPASLLLLGLGLDVLDRLIRRRKQSQ